MVNVVMKFKIWSEKKLNVKGWLSQGINEINL